MKQQIIINVMQQMLPHLDNAQMQKLQKVLEIALFNCEITAQTEKKDTDDNPKLIEAFVAAKRIEGCSEKTLKYYRITIETMVASIDKGIRHIQTEDLRSYLTDYQSKNQSSRVTIDNIRRILSSFFSWLEDEDYILKSPVRRIHKVKTATNIKETYTDEEIRQTVQQTYEETGYLLDPHGACGYRALAENLQPGETGVFLETAHPAKFLQTVESIIGKEVKIPEKLQAFMRGEKQSVPMSKEFAAFKEYLLNY